MSGVNDSIARFAGSNLVDGFDPGACAPGFMLASALRTHPVATAPGTDLIAPQAEKSLTSILRNRC